MALTGGTIRNVRSNRINTSEKRRRKDSVYGHYDPPGSTTVSTQQTSNYLRPNS